MYMSELTISDTVFTSVTDFLRTHSGLVLKRDKAYLLETRLGPIATAHGHDNVDSLLQALHDKKLPTAAQNDIVEALTTNETLFLRDRRLFDALVKKILPDVISSASTPIKVWCAACSSGQEPYSVLMHANQMGNIPLESIQIDATDLSPAIVERAKTGIYSQFEVQRGLPIQYLMKYFTELPHNKWQMSDKAQKQISFATANLLEPTQAPRAQYDIIMCRNVLIYFDEETKNKVLASLATKIRANGYLIIGATESLDQTKLPQFTVCADDAAGVYQRKA
jgi:chemotaxis protein methyltransferase CheR